MVAIANANLISGVFETLYDLITSQVSDPQIPARSKWWFSTYPDNRLQTKADFPIGIINPPNYSWQDFTIKRKWAIIDISIDIYSTSAREADELVDSVLDALETNRVIFGQSGLIKYNVTGTNSSVFKNGEITLHVRTASISFMHVVQGSL